MNKMLLLAVLAATSAPALAATTETVSKSVFVGDLNLASPRGVATLDRRLDQAAMTVCNARNARALWERRDADRCLAATRERIASQREAVLAGARTEIALAR